MPLSPEVRNLIISEVRVITEKQDTESHRALKDFFKVVPIRWKIELGVPRIFGENVRKKIEVLTWAFLQIFSELHLRLEDEDDNEIFRLLDDVAIQARPLFLARLSAVYPSDCAWTEQLSDERLESARADAQRKIKRYALKPALLQTL